MSQPKTYLITGANRGLGLEFVRQISATATPTTPHTVFACVRSTTGELDELKDLAGSVSSASTIRILECDTSSMASIRSCASQVSQVLTQTGQNLTYLINNAGINSAPTTTALTFSPTDLEAHLNINVIGPSTLVQALEPHLTSGSLILNMSSGLGSCGRGIESCAAYAVSKSALNMLTRQQSYALRERGVVVVAMDPGHVQTRMGGDAAVLTPEESIKGVLGVVDGLGMEGTGRFYTSEGEESLW